MNIFRNLHRICSVVYQLYKLFLHCITGKVVSIDKAEFHSHVNFPRCSPLFGRGYGEGRDYFPTRTVDAFVCEIVTGDECISWRRVVWEEACGPVLIGWVRDGEVVDWQWIPFRLVRKYPRYDGEPTMKGHSGT